MFEMMDKDASGGVSKAELAQWIRSEINDTESQRIYNSHYGNGAPAMFTS
jgi:Ca2+-binding EF-hand superfamily protein